MSRMKETDDFGNRMKAYESVETERRLERMLPIYARIDGRSFSRLTRHMERPFDARLTAAMVATAKHLVEHTHARIGYVQSDEISLVWLAETERSDIFFSGKVQKMTSVLASMAAARFMLAIESDLWVRLPHFDRRVFQIPNKIEAANAILWRAMDARKNAVSMVAQAHFSHKQLHGKDQSAMLAMLAEAGVDFEAYPEINRRGAFLRRETELRELTEAELGAIPPAHRPTGPVVRNNVRVLPMPAFNTVANRVEVVFDGERPLVFQD